MRRHIQKIVIALTVAAIVLLAAAAARSLVVRLDISSRFQPLPASTESEPAAEAKQSIWEVEAVPAITATAPVTVPASAPVSNTSAPAIANYAPDMVTSKPCPRVTAWTFKVVDMESPFQDYGIVDDPCVVQNAIDDLVKVAPVLPLLNTPQSAQESVSRLETDPALIAGIEPNLRAALVKGYRGGTAAYVRCDQPAEWRLDVDARSPLVANMGGGVDGRAIQLTLRLSDASGHPLTCALMPFSAPPGAGGRAPGPHTPASNSGVHAWHARLVWDAIRERWVLYAWRPVPAEAGSGARTWMPPCTAAPSTAARSPAVLPKRA
jgi:hypothetical protein